MRRVILSLVAAAGAVFGAAAMQQASAAPLAGQAVVRQAADRMAPAAPVRLRRHDAYRPYVAPRRAYRTHVYRPHVYRPAYHAPRRHYFAPRTYRPAYVYARSWSRRHPWRKRYMRPRYYAPTYYYNEPQVYAPAPVYVAPPVYSAPAYVAPFVAPRPLWGGGWGHRHHGWRR